MKTVVHDWPKYVEGDLFAEIKKAPRGHKILIPHVVNNIGKWGAGFTGPLGEAFPEARKDYLLRTPLSPGRMNLGITDFVESDAWPGVKVANMFAQDGVGSGDRQIRYEALTQCMIVVGITALAEGRAIHCPKFGAGLAGGNWDFIEELIRDCWIRRGIEVTVYWLPDMPKARKKFHGAA